MTPLHELVNSIGFTIPQTMKADPNSLDDLCEKLMPLYETSRSKFPEHSDLELLLGLLSVHHDRLLHQLNAQREALVAMQEVIDQSLDRSHSRKFKAPVIVEFWLTMHLWVYLQGMLKLDYSLANDYAAEAGEMLSPMTDKNPDQLRVEWNQTYYVGRDAKQNNNSFLKQVSGSLRKLLK